MDKAASKSLVLVLTLAGLLAAGCGADSASDVKATAPPAGSDAPEIQEPDLYRLFGKHLYVQNPQTGLNILDVTDKTKPRLVGRAPVTGGAGSEMYLVGDLAVILLKSATSQCRSPLKLDPAGWSLGSEVAFVDVSSKTHPRVMQRYCLPGSLVASRTVDQILYVVTSYKTSGSRAISINIADPHQAAVVQQLSFPDASKEIIVLPEGIYLAGSVTATNGANTRIGYIQIDGKGKMTPRGTLNLVGSPMGRFHMDVEGTDFRIVTYDKYSRQTRLSIVSLKDPDHPVLVGQINNIARGERLYATRFDGDRAYVVTFRRTDPLWVIDLSTPQNPTVVGELHVPGWSDFLFPRGNKLIAVGRGDNGRHLGVSLFDVSDPTKPRSLHQITLGDPNGTSEANVDHRAVNIVEVPGKNPLVVVPHTRVSYGDGGCKASHQLKMVEVQASRLVAQGEVTQQGTIRRSLMVGQRLYSISDYEVLAVDISSPAQPRVDTRVTVGNNPNADSSSYSQYCYYGNDMVMGDDTFRGPFEFLCSMGPAGQGLPLPPPTVLLGLAWLAITRLRRRQ